MPAADDSARKLNDLIREVAERRGDSPRAKPVEWEFFDTAEGITLVMEDGMVRGATAVELAQRAELDKLRARFRPVKGEPPLRTAERMIVRGLIDSGLGNRGQSQVGHADRFEIATDDLIIHVKENPDAHAT